MTRAALYDDDVIVLGSGPAGLAAAIRARWLKGYAAFPASVTVIGAGPLGGLLPWGGAILSGPGWAYKGEELLQHLRADIERFAIPVLEGQATAVRREGEFLRVEGAGFAARRTLAVVIAAGFRAVGGEAAYFQKGVFITFKGYEYFPTLIREALAFSRGRGLLVVGNEQSEELIPLFKAARGAGAMTFLLDAEAHQPLSDAFPGRVMRGRLADVRAIGGDPGRGFRVTSDEGGRRGEITCGAVLLDYHAFERKPSWPSAAAMLAAEENLFARLRRDERGFIETDRWMATSEPGVFAAGDITGRYSSTLMALGDGVCAGFSAYRHAYRAKFGREPRLFAYAAADEVIEPGASDLPHLAEESRPKLLGRADELLRFAERAGITLPDAQAQALFDGRRDFRQLAAALSCGVDALRRLVLDSAAARLMTVHTLWGEQAGAAPAREPREAARA